MLTFANYYFMYLHINTHFKILMLTMKRFEFDSICEYQDVFCPVKVFSFLRGHMRTGCNTDTVTAKHTHQPSVSCSEFVIFGSRNALDTHAFDQKCYWANYGKIIYIYPEIRKRVITTSSNPFHGDHTRHVKHFNRA
jgi:hypothetical protein